MSENRILSLLAVRNFQPYKDVVLEFVNGVNVITGTSDVGKSAFVRALSWPITNRPQGFGFKSNFADDKEETEVELQFADGSWVLRSRDDKRSVYELPGYEGDDALEALRGDVPGEVQEIIDFKDYNIQNQHDKYFLLQNTPGEVARELSSVAGLDDIDIVIKNINKIVSDTDAEKKKADADIEKYTEQFKQFVNLPEIESVVSKLESMLNEREDKRLERRTLLDFIQNINGASDRIEEIDLWLEIEPKTKVILQESKELEKALFERKGINDRLNDVVDIDNKIIEFDRIIEPGERLKSLKVDIQKHKKDIQDFEELGQVVESLLTIDDRIEQCDNLLQELNNEKLELLSLVDVCPTCGQVIK